MFLQKRISVSHRKKVDSLSAKEICEQIFLKKQSLKNIKNVVACLVDSLINVIIILYKPYFLQHQGFYFNSISTGDKIKKQEKKQRDIYFLLN